VVIHGGGFVVGSRTMKPVRLLAARLVATGAAVCAIDYRMILRGGRLDEAVDDVAEALHWWREQTATHDLDPHQICALGLSAGGALMLLAAGRGDAALERMVGLFGIYDFGHLQGGVGAMIPARLMRTRDREIWQQRSPVSAPQAPCPLLLIHGTEDGLVPVEQAETLRSARAAAQLPTQTLIIPGAPHGFLNWPNAAADEALIAIEAFVATGTVAP
ncbi:MAG: acetyl esterase/lipase, partial [Myxococcota bacterium]